MSVELELPEAIIGLIPLDAILMAGRFSSKQRSSMEFQKMISLILLPKA